MDQVEKASVGRAIAYRAWRDCRGCMSASAQLSELMEALKFESVARRSYFDRQTGRIVSMNTSRSTSEISRQVGQEPGEKGSVPPGDSSKKAPLFHVM
jgi:hypothetical protein